MPIQDPPFPIVIEPILVTWVLLKFCSTSLLYCPFSKDLKLPLIRNIVGTWWIFHWLWRVWKCLEFSFECPIRVWNSCFQFSMGYLNNLGSISSLKQLLEAQNISRKVGTSCLEFKIILPRCKIGHFKFRTVWNKSILYIIIWYLLNDQKLNTISYSKLDFLNPNC